MSSGAHDGRLQQRPATAGSRIDLGESPASSTSASRPPSGPGAGPRTPESSPHLHQHLGGLSFIQATCPALSTSTVDTTPCDSPSKAATGTPARAPQQQRQQQQKLEEQPLAPRVITGSQAKAPPDTSTPSTGTSSSASRDISGNSLLARARAEVRALGVYVNDGAPLDPTAGLEAGLPLPAYSGTAQDLVWGVGGFPHWQRYPQQQQPCADLRVAGPADDAEEELAAAAAGAPNDWASPDEIRQMRALSRELIEYYQSEIGKLSDELRRARLERDTLLAEARTTRDHKTAYETGRKQCEAAVHARQAWTEEKEFLRLEVRKLVTDNEKLKLALQKRKSASRRALSCCHGADLLAALGSLSLNRSRACHAPDTAQRDMAPPLPDRLGDTPSSPLPSPSFTGTAGAATATVGTCTTRASSHSAPAAVPDYDDHLHVAVTHREEEQQQHRSFPIAERDGGECRREAAPAAGADSREGAQRERESPHHNNHQHRPRAREELRPVMIRYEGSAHAFDGLVSLATRDGGVRNEEDGGRDRAGSEPIAAGSVTTPSLSDTSVPDGVHAEAEGQGAGEDGASARPEYAIGLSDASHTTATTTTTIASRKPVVEVTQSLHTKRSVTVKGGVAGQTLPVPFMTTDRDGGKRRAQPMSITAVVDPAATTTAITATTPAATTASTSSTSNTVHSSTLSALARLYQLPRTPAEAITAETQLLAAVDVLQRERDVLASRVGLMEQMLRRHQREAQICRAMGAHAHEGCERRLRERTEALTEVEAERTRLLHAVAHGRAEQLAAAHRERRQADDHARVVLEMRAAHTSALAAQRVAMEEESRHAREAAAERVADAEAQARAAQHELEALRQRSEESLRVALASAHSAEAAHGAALRAHRSTQEELTELKRRREADAAAQRQERSTWEEALALAMHRREAAEATAEQLAGELRTCRAEVRAQYEAIQTMDARLTESCEALLALENLKEVHALACVRANEEAEEKAAIEKELAASATVLQSALTSMQDEHASTLNKLAVRLERAEARYERLKVKFTAALKEGRLAKTWERDRARVDDGGGARTGTQGTRGDRSRPAEGGGEAMLAPQGLGVDAREVLRASAAAAARLAYAIGHGDVTR